MMTKKKPELLWIEDNDRFIKKMRYAFADDYNITHAIDVKQAFEFLNGELKFNLILLDIIFEDTIGTEVFGHIERLKQSKHIPLIVVSSKSELSTVVSAIKQKADNYLYKGDFDELKWKTTMNACIKS